MSQVCAWPNGSAGVAGLREHILHDLLIESLLTCLQWPHTKPLQLITLVLSTLPRNINYSTVWSKQHQIVPWQGKCCQLSSLKDPNHGARGAQTPQISATLLKRASQSVVMNMRSTNQPLNTQTGSFASGSREVGALHSVTRPSGIAILQHRLSPQLKCLSHAYPVKFHRLR